MEAFTQARRCRYVTDITLFLSSPCKVGDMIHILQMKLRGREVIAQSHIGAKARLDPGPLMLQPLLLLLL